LCKIFYKIMLQENWHVTSIVKLNKSISLGLHKLNISRNS